MARSGSSLGSQPLVPRKFWSAIVSVQLFLLVNTAMASRMLEQQTSLQRRQFQAFIDNTNKPRHAPPLQSFLVSDGTWVDCIPIEGQISAHHPALKDHVIQLMPSPSCRPSGRARPEVHPQLFAREHGGCPEGSVPVQRTDLNHPLPQKTQSPLSTQAVPAAAGDPTHEYAITQVPEVPQSYSGAHSILSVNGPDLGVIDEDFSLSQIWIVDGSRDDNTLSTIEVGWQKFPQIHQNKSDGDPLAPHLFVFWTDNAYNVLKDPNATGTCYNLDCPGFVRNTDTKWVIGGAMPSYTVLAQNAQTESEVEIEVLYDTSSQNWWLFLNTDPVGYWPASIFNGRLQGSARLVQWGGEVFFNKDNTTTLHSNTAMGSGAFPSAGYPTAAYHKKITYADATGSSISPDPSVLDQPIVGNSSGKFVTKPLCYDIAIQQDPEGTYFFFGGPGGLNNPACVA